MVTLSPSQKKTVFAVALLALIAVGVMISGRGGFSGLRSDAFNNPSFVCSEETQAADKDKYDQAGADMEKWTAEKTKLQTFAQKWSSDIRKSEAQVKQAEREKTAAEKNVVNIEKYIKDSCSATALKSLQQGGRAGNGTAYNNRQQTCNQKKNDLQKAKQDVNKAQTQITQAKAAIAAIGHGSITNVQGQIPALEQKIQTAKNYREDYEKCGAHLSINIIPACAYTSSELGTAVNLGCKNEKGISFPWHPTGQQGIEYHLVMQVSETKDVSIHNVSFSLGNTNESKLVFSNIRLATGIMTDDIISTCQRQGTIISCPIPSPVTLEKGSIVQWYLNADIEVREDHTYEIDVSEVNVGGGYSSKNKKGDSSVSTRAYAQLPFQGPVGNATIWEDTKTQTVIFGEEAMQTIYEIRIKAENGGIILSDMLLRSAHGFGSEGQEFLDCLEPTRGNTLFEGQMKLYDGDTLIAESEENTPGYKKFNLEEFYVITAGTERQLTIRALVKESGPTTNCSFTAWPNSIASTAASFDTSAHNYVTHIIPAPICGNSIIEHGEQCDDGNTNNDDICDNQCRNSLPLMSGEVRPILQGPYTATEAAQKLADMGVIGNHSSNPANYRLNQAINKQEFLGTMLSILGLIPQRPLSEYVCKNTFSDTQEPWVCRVAEIAYENGIIAHNGSGTFRGSQNLTNFEVTTLSLRAIGCALPKNTPMTQFELIKIGERWGILNLNDNYVRSASRGDAYITFATFLDYFEKNAAENPTYFYANSIPSCKERIENAGSEKPNICNILGTC